jgi:hypothetical protein
VDEPSLADAYAKLDRAATHLAELKAKIVEFRKSRPYYVAIEGDVDTGEWIAIVKPRQQPDGLGVVVGDIVSNLRAALDYLVYALAWLDSGSPQRKTQFPIADAPKEFQAKAKTWLKGVNATHVAALEATQPCKPGYRWLGVLRELSNTDKHMHVHLMRAETIGDLEVRDDADPEAPSLARATDPNALNVHVDFDITLVEAFEDGARVLETLEILQPSVSALIHEFDPEFQGQ